MLKSTQKNRFYRHGSHTETQGRFVLQESEFGLEQCGKTLPNHAISREMPL
ncbi:hypothetical protein DPMN_074975 [Dreissena polymorpha]|uniref:Uncharacterized protein n=1 Tax=Dreissena polymorpha TaxID=45954 RepID=A0A9D3YFZ4_DREPO|nr:hypothetical protein DPMN_074975 [Dreissena polymorpha]